MINKVILIGNVGREPEQKTLDSGTSLVKFSVATSENYRDKAGEWQERTEWHTVICWGTAADKALSISKGDKVYVEGRLTTRTYEVDGQKRYTTEINANYTRVLHRKEADVMERIGEEQRAAVTAFNNMPDEAQLKQDGDLPF